LFDVRTHSGAGGLVDTPTRQRGSQPSPQSGQISDRALEVGDALLHQRAHVDARPLAGSSEGDDVPDLSQAEPEPPCAADEREQREHVVSEHAIPGWRAGRRNDDPRRLV
jgi:hypothetical protein